MKRWRVSRPLNFSLLALVALWPQPAFALDVKADGSTVWQVLGLIGCASIGSLILYLFGQPTKADFLAVRFPNWTPSWKKEVASFVIYVLVGGVIGYFIAGPESARGAFMSGFGWPALLDLGAARREKDVAKGPPPEVVS
jgi:hypothetical protein